MKVAFVHDWLVTYRGGEKVLEALLELYPEAPIFTLFYDPTKMPATITSRSVIYPKWINKFKKVRKMLLPLYPAIIESMPMETYDLIISTSSCVAKGAMTGPTAKHICYIHSPMRYIWDQRNHYLKTLKKIPLLGFLIDTISCKLRLWDVNSNHRVDQFIANSNFVKQRVRKCYNRDAVVIAPPVDIEAFKTNHDSISENRFFLVAGAFVSYKRFDLAIRACEIANVKLVIAGNGPQEKKLKQLAGNNVEFHIAPDRNQWRNLMAQAEGFIFPGIEDFGITAIEALAAGTPLLAYRAGGALDFVIPGKTGLFFDSLEPRMLAEAINNFSKASFDQNYIQKFASKFSQKQFQEQMKNQIHYTLENDSAI